jgi:hypothetical protein
MQRSQAKQSKTIHLSNVWSTTPAKQSIGKHPVNAYVGNTALMEEEVNAYVMCTATSSATAPSTHSLE